MIDNKKLLGNDNDIFQIKEVLEKSLDNKWTQEFVYLLRKFFYIEYWSNVEKNERYTIQMIQEILKKHLDFLDEDRRTEEVLRKFRAMLPYLQQLVISDMKAAYEGDPAAKSYEEIIAAYPGPLAVLIQRTANCLYQLKVPILPRIMTEYAHSITGIDIHPGAEIGESFFIDHGTGVVIGETAVIGNHVKIYQGVTLGALSTRGGHKQKWLKRHPTVEDNVNEIRPLMKRISVLAEKYQCAIILIGHMNKNSNGKSSYRGLGSIDFQAAARSVLIVGRVKDEPEIRVICHVKSSLAPEGDAIAFRLDKEKGFHWIGKYDISADDLLSGDGRGQKIRSAKDFLKEILANGSMEQAKIAEEAEERGIKKKTLWNAKKELQIDSVKIGNKWFWMLQEE